MVMLILPTFLLYNLKKKKKSPTVPLMLLAHEFSFNNSAFWHKEWPDIPKLYNHNYYPSFVKESWLKRRGEEVNWGAGPRPSMRYKKKVTGVPEESHYLKNVKLRTLSRVDLLLSQI